MSPDADSDRERHLLHVFATFYTGGPAVRACQVLSLAPRSWRHTVVSMDGRFDCREQMPPEVQVQYQKPPAARGFFAMARAMARLQRELSPDLVLTYNWGAIESVLATRWTRLPLVHHEDGFGPEESERYLRRRIWARRLLLGAATAIVVPSRVLRELAVTRWRRPAAQVHYLPNGVDLSRFVAVARDSQGDPEPVIGHVGQFRGEKNQQQLLQAFASCRSRDRARLLLFGGDDDGQRHLEQLTRELGIRERVTFAGTTADTSTVYRKMDVFALSSRTEQMPLTVLEAMACGLPVVSTDVGDVRHMVCDANRGLIVPKDDTAALAAALDRVLDDPGLRRSLGDENRRRCQQEYDQEVCYRRYLDLYRQLSAGNPR
ncbi:MAG: glycosyltransferase family 4 protein [Planctomycetota bacterium]|jgi:glycosyltransferase involved in cell wall biosynthesis